MAVVAALFCGVTAMFAFEAVDRGHGRLGAALALASGFNLAVSLAVALS